MTPPSPSPVQVGDLVVGKYRVERVLGHGGMGVVVQAMHEQLDQRVALKFLLPEVSSHAEIVQRFIREARASVRIHSEHVARVLDVGTLPAGVPFMVMEFLHGEDLAHVLARTGPMPVAQAVGYVLEALEAVAEAHALGMVHRDLKPANLFLANRPTGRPLVKVLDFGISKIPASERDQAITRTSAVMGSPGYMSPEQMMSSDKVDGRSDIWSMGVVLYELLGQRLPFPGNTMPELIAAILQKTPQPLSAYRDDIPIGLVTVLDTCFQKEPAGRYANVADFARALAPFGPPRAEQSVERIEAVLGVGHVSVPPVPYGTDPGVRTAVVATFSPTTSQPSRTSGRLVVPGIVVGVGLVGLVVFLALRTSRPAVAPSAAASSIPSASAAPATSAPVTLAPSPSVSTNPSTIDDAPGATTAAAPSKPHPVGPSHPTPAVPTTAAPSPTPAPAPPAGSCHVVSYFDADGNKHFKQECP
jgi:serine/threonine-protein kinase